MAIGTFIEREQAQRAQGIESSQREEHLRARLEYLEAARVAAFLQ